MRTEPLPRRGSFLQGSPWRFFERQRLPLRWVRQRHNSAAQAGGLCGCGGMPNSGSLAHAVPFLQRVALARQAGALDAAKSWEMSSGQVVDRSACVPRNSIEGQHAGAWTQKRLPVLCEPTAFDSYTTMVGKCAAYRLRSSRPSPLFCLALLGGVVTGCKPGTTSCTSVGGRSGSAASR